MADRSAEIAVLPPLYQANGSEQVSESLEQASSVDHLLELWLHGQSSQSQRTYRADMVRICHRGREDADPGHSGGSERVYQLLGRNVDGSPVLNGQPRLCPLRFTRSAGRKKLVNSNTDLRQNKIMATDGNINLPDDLLSQVQAIAERQGKTADDFMAQVAKREVARQLILELQRERKPSGMTEEEEMEVVNQAVHDYRLGR